VRVAQTLEDASGTDAASRTLGLVSPAAQEYRRLGIDTDALRAFADAGGGRTLGLDPPEAEGPSVWDHDIGASAFPTPIWPWLLLIAMVLVPIDVGVRRVALSRADLRRARSWLARRAGLGQPAPDAVPGLAELRAAKERSARRSARSTEADAPAPAAAPAPPRRVATPHRSRPAQSPAPEPADETDGMADPSAPRVEPATETLAERLARRRRSG
jgi:hypothetical protein